MTRPAAQGRALRLSFLAAAMLLAGCAGVTNDPEETSGAGIGETDGMCAGIAGFPCEAEADYCAMEAGQCVDIADAAGVCRPRPEACTMEYLPVCGCDGETYSNSCSAASRGASVAYEGECRDGD